MNPCTREPGWLVTGYDLARQALGVPYQDRFQGNVGKFMNSEFRDAGQITAYSEVPAYLAVVAAERAHPCRRTRARHHHGHLRAAAESGTAGRATCRPGRTDEDQSRP
ncbi:hypothetical protein Ssi02_65460 [Sinosporangium siamense]|uniref:Uncharacterized protein n=1 Tax=Sinosporangium siamense TaxID=1367973 RepID=A0A919V8N3_9ACTN|nr:hypothetical protein Ssi02_65460 [Sinosporangium siamense]